MSKGWLISVSKRNPLIAIHSNWKRSGFLLQNPEWDRFVVVVVIVITPAVLPEIFQIKKLIKHFRMFVNY